MVIISTSPNETIVDKINCRGSQKKYPKKVPKQKEVKLVVRTSVIKGIEIPNKDLPSDVSQCDLESDTLDSDSEHVP